MTHVLLKRIAGLCIYGTLVFLLTEFFSSTSIVYKWNIASVVDASFYLPPSQGSLPWLCQLLSKGPKAYTHCHHLPRSNHIFLHHRKHILQAQFVDEQSLRELTDTMVLSNKPFGDTKMYQHKHKHTAKDIKGWYCILTKVAKMGQILTKHTSNVFNCCRRLLQAQPKRWTKNRLEITSQSVNKPFSRKSSENSAYNKEGTYDSILFIEMV